MPNVDKRRYSAESSRNGIKSQKDCVDKIVLDSVKRCQFLPAIFVV